MSASRKRDYRPDWVASTPDSQPQASISSTLAVGARRLWPLPSFSILALPALPLSPPAQPPAPLTRSPPSVFWSNICGVGADPLDRPGHNRTPKGPCGERCHQAAKHMLMEQVKPLTRLTPQSLPSLLQAGAESYGARSSTLLFSLS